MFVQNFETAYGHQDCIVIPINENGLFVAPNGCILVNLEMKRVKKPKRGTHSIRIKSSSYRQKMFERGDFRFNMGYARPTGWKYDVPYQIDDIEDNVDSNKKEDK